MWPHTLSYHTYSGHDMTLDQLFEGYNYGHDCHHYAHATNGHDPHDVCQSRHCLQDVKMPKFWGRLLPIYPFHNRQSKIHPRKNHNYYYVCMSTAFIKGRKNPVGFTDCSLTPPVFANCQKAQSWRNSFSISPPPAQKEHLFRWLNLASMFLWNWHRWKCKTFLPFFNPEIFMLIFLPHKRALLSTF